MTRIEPIEITAEQFRLLRARTVRCNGDAKAIFSTNVNEDLWPPTRLGKTPHHQREEVAGRTHVLAQLAKCFRWHREDVGRIFVTEDGAYWKEGAAFETRKVQFARWEWIGEPPERPRPLTAEENAVLTRK